VNPPRVPKSAGVKARDAADAAAARPSKTSTHDTAHGPVTLGDVRYVAATDTAPAHVEVFVVGDTERGDPHYRVVNPPRYATDPTGPIEINGRRFREDPLAALAEAVGRFGGARPRRAR
jgi:hypothetical protein